MKTYLGKVLAALFLAATVGVSAEGDIPDAHGQYMPVIGILSYEYHFNGGNIIKVDGAPEYTSYIEAAYVKYVEAGGGRAAPIQYDLPDDALYALLSKVNGVLLPGGNINLHDASPVYKTVEKILEYALEANKKLDYFPVWGTCMGYEAVVRYFGKDKFYMHDTDFKDANSVHTLDWSDRKQLRHSRALNSCGLVAAKSAGAASIQYLIDNLGGGWPDDQFVTRGAPLCVPGLFEAAQNHPLAAFNHMRAITPESWYNSEYLTEAFMVLSTSKTYNGTEMISTIEHRTAPIYGTQWHPEKNLFLNYPATYATHTQDASQLSQYFANFLISEARLSKHRFSSNKELFYSLFYLIPKHLVVTKPFEEYMEAYFFRDPREGSSLLYDPIAEDVFSNPENPENHLIADPPLMFDAL